MSMRWITIKYVPYGDGAEHYDLTEDNLYVWICHPGSGIYKHITSRCNGYDLYDYAPAVR